MKVHITSKGFNRSRTLANPSKLSTLPKTPKVSKNALTSPLSPSSAETFSTELGSLVNESPPKNPSPQASNADTMTKALKISNFELINESPGNFFVFGASAAVTPTRTQRKISRSQTELNTPITPTWNNFEEVIEPINPFMTYKENALNRTQVITEPNNCDEPDQCLNNEVKFPLTKLHSFNPKEKSIDIFEYDKPVDFDDSFNLSENRFSVNDAGLTPKSADIGRSFQDYQRNRHRSSVMSNGRSSGMSEAHYEVLSTLTQSVKELNLRLIRSEECTMEQLNSNLALRNTINILESRLEDHKNHKVESKSIDKGCSSNCSIF